MKGRLGWVVGIGLAAMLLVVPASSNSGGARAGSAEQGCTCHGTANAGVTLELAAPAGYEAGQTYNLTFKVLGAAAPLPVVAANMGGLAVKASSGELIASVPGQTKVLDDGMLTHTEGGNDQREWVFRWKAPSPGAGNVTFSFAGNGVNGGRTADGDQWNKGTKIVPGAPVPATNSSAPTSAGGSGPGLAPLVSGAAVVAALGLHHGLVARRNRGQR